MEKKASSEKDEERLTKKVAERQKVVGNPEGDAGLRALRKRLKRTQRKRRTLTARRRHAAGKAGGAAEKPQSAAET